MVSFRIGIIVFIVVFLLFFYFVYKAEKNKQNNPFFITFVVSLTFGLLISFLVMALIYLFSGSAKLMDVLFNFEITQKQIFYLSVSYLIYNVLFEGIIFIIIKQMFMDNNFVNIVGVSLLRFIVLLGIGAFLSINKFGNIIIALGIIIVTYMLEYVSKGIETKHK
ncbi:MAG TPA: hypothetical protein GXX18_07545 [Bacillales bacterium]|nr:hypothetical protein [Bacillales bacterium]